MLRLAVLLLAFTTPSFAQGDFQITRPVLKVPAPETQPPIIVPPRYDPRNPVGEPKLDGSWPRVLPANPLKTVLLLFVEVDGKVSAASVMDSSGWEKHDDAAITAALAWTLLPGTVNGKPAAMPRAFKVITAIEENGSSKP